MGRISTVMIDFVNQTYLYFFQFLKTPRLGRIRYLSLILFWNLIALISFGCYFYSVIENKKLLFALSVVSIVVCIVMRVLLDIRRLHDFNRTGVWALLNFPLHGLLSIIIGLIPGTKGPNKYGVRLGNTNFLHYILVFTLFPVVIIMLFIGLSFE